VAEAVEDQHVPKSGATRQLPPVACGILRRTALHEGAVDEPLDLVRVRVRVRVGVRVRVRVRVPLGLRARGRLGVL
jgi:hypothetical protein